MKKNKPEEIVRQSIIQQMLKIGYPKSCIVVEKKLEGVDLRLNRRTDLLIYYKSPSASVPSPIMLVECKATKPNEEAIFQLMGYNHYINARFVALAWHSQFMYLDLNNQEQQWITGIPNYQYLQS